MKRLIAGVYAPRGADDEHADRARAALVAEGPVESAQSGALTVAWTVGDRARDPGGDGFCLVDGVFYEIGLDANPGDGSTEAQLLAGWRRGGDGFLAQLRGDFAVLLWDGAAQTGVLACDHMGSRSLAWHEQSGVVSFASEIHLLLRLLPRTPGPDQVTVAHWLAVSGLPGDRTLYEGVRRLGAAEVLELGSPPRVRRYWTPRYAGVERVGEEEAVARVGDALALAVRRRCADARSTGIMLSGGLDSGAVAAVSRHRVPPDQAPASSYSATFPDHPTADESVLIDSVAQALELPNVRIEVRGGSVLAGALPYLARWEVPPVSPNLFFWLPLLDRVAEDGTEVLLDGEGGDELFGVAAHLLADRLRRGRIASVVSLLRRVPGSQGRLSRRWTPSWVREYALKGAAPVLIHHAVRRWRGPQAYAPPWFFERTARDYVETDTAPDWKAVAGPRWWAFLISATSRGMGPALTFDHIRRRGAMAGVESRHPLLDVDLVETVLRLPPELSFDPERNRPLLRASVAGILPDDVRLRIRKGSFDPPFHDALAGCDLPALRSLLGAPDSEVGAYVDLPAMRADLLDREPPPPLGRQAWALRVWRLATAELWLRSLATPGAAERLAGLEPVRYRMVAVPAPGR